VAVFGLVLTYPPAMKCAHPGVTYRGGGEGFAISADADEEPVEAAEVAMAFLLLLVTANSSWGIYRWPQ
jgi:hypothetical protein